MPNPSTSALGSLLIIISNIWPNWRYTLVFPSLSPKYSTLVVSVLSPREPAFSVTQFFTEHRKPGTCFHLVLSFYNNISCQKIISSITIHESTTSHLFVCPKISKSTPIQLIHKFIKLSWHHGYSFSISYVNEGGDLTQSEYFMKLWFDHEVIVQTTSGYISSINSKVERPQNTIKIWSASKSSTMDTIVTSCLSTISEQSGSFPSL